MLVENIIMIFFVVLVIIFLIGRKSDISNFKHVLPKKRYLDIVKEFGRPDLLINKSGGLALWKNKDYFTKIILKDESIEHPKPKPHCDFLYATINVYIPQGALCEILGLSQSIYYDSLKRELTARCHFMGANVATLYLAMKMLVDPDNIETYKTQYGPTIMSTMKKENYTKMYSELKKMVDINKKMYKDKMPNRNCYIEA